MTTTPVARKNDRITSVEAGETVAPRSTAREDVLWILRRTGPLADPDIEAIHDLHAARGRWPAKSPQRLRTARAELVADGVVVPCTIDGETVTTRLPSGYRSIVWAIA